MYKNNRTINKHGGRHFEHAVPPISSPAVRTLLLPIKPVCQPLQSSIEMAAKLVENLKIWHF